MVSSCVLSLRSSLPGLGMVPTSSIPQGASSIPRRCSVVVPFCGIGLSDHSALVDGSSGFSVAFAGDSLSKNSPPFSAVHHATQRSKNSLAGLARLAYNLETRRWSRVCRGAVEIGGAQTIQEQKTEVIKGSRVKVKGPLKVYHIPKVPEFDIDGLEGEVKGVLREWKGKPISANLPYKVQFFAHIDGREIKFVAHLKDGEFEVVE